MVFTSVVIAVSIGLGTAGLDHSAPAHSAEITCEGEVSDAARCIRDYIAAMNAGTPVAIGAFEQKYRAPEALEMRPISERIAQARRIGIDMGAMSLREIVGTQPASATAIIDTEKTGAIECTFEFDSGGKLKGIMIEPAGAAPLDAAARAETIEQLATSLAEGYVFPEVGRTMADHLRAALASGKYDALTAPRDLARRLTDDLQAISKDKHLRVRPAPARTPRPAGPASAGPRQGPLNAGFKKVEILEGNVGYIRFDGFVHGEEAQRIAAAAMNFIASCDSVIFDMRFNGGGSPEMIRFISSYIFEQPTHLNSFYDRNGKRTEEYWTHAEIPGKRLGSEVRILVLTSGYTFSGAEEFSYNLQALGRATIIGERTGGGAHPVRMAPVGEKFAVSLPFARAENPITKANWEGVGVEPDIEVKASEALERALEHLLISAAEAIPVSIVQREPAAR
jgi:hypothetical protein